DPEGPLSPSGFRQLANIYASSCHPMLEFEAFMLALPLFTHSHAQMGAELAGVCDARSSGCESGLRVLPDFLRVAPGAGLSSRTSGIRTSRGSWNSSQRACQVVTPSRALAICDRSSDDRCGRLPLSTSSEIVNSTPSCQANDVSTEVFPFSASTMNRP